MGKRITHAELKAMIERAETTRLYISGHGERHYLRCHILQESILCIGVDSHGNESESVELRDGETLVYDRGCIRIAKRGILIFE